jgi:hypothetical protein
VSLLFALAVTEVGLRIFYPINDGRANVTLEGERIESWFEPGSVYRQVSNEYDAITTITDKSHRVPGASGNPDVVFIGDSFTYGFGLNDDETFASIYCRQQHVACANLGLPGSGTARQVDRLAKFIADWDWRPREVKLFFFGMSTSFSHGNDFVDNYEHGRWLHAQSSSGPKRSDPPRLPLTARLLSWQYDILERSNLMRVAKYHWGPLLKSAVVAHPGERMAEALAYTREDLHALDDLGRRVGFDYQIYLLVPVQDIIRGTHSDTLATLNGVSPRPAIATAPLFVDSPGDFYYSYDGHLNAKGSRRIAEFLVSLEDQNAAARHSRQ